MTFFAFFVVFSWVLAIARMGRLSLRNLSERYQLHHVAIWMKNCIVSKLLYYFLLLLLLCSFNLLCTVPFANQKSQTHSISIGAAAFLCLSIVFFSFDAQMLSHKMRNKMLTIYNLSVAQNPKAWIYSDFLCTYFSKASRIHKKDHMVVLLPSSFWIPKIACYFELTVSFASHINYW